ERIRLITILLLVSELVSFSRLVLLVGPPHGSPETTALLSVKQACERNAFSGVCCLFPFALRERNLI
ncbi:hypothetical protein BHE74_00058344, partial [Ensete ventricosum]